MKQMYYVITTLFMGILLCACEKEEVDTFPSDLTRSEWCTEPLVSGEMYVYEFSSMTIGTPNGSGKKHRSNAPYHFRNGNSDNNKCQNNQNKQGPLRKIPQS